MKLKKTGILLLALVFILECFSVSAAEHGNTGISVKNDKTGLSYETQVVAGLGIMETEKDYNPDAQITRVNFAKIVSNLISFTDEKDIISSWDFYEKKNSEEVEIKDIDYRYIDVDDEIDGYREIEMLAQSGIMIGDGSGNFNPQKPITKKQAVTVMLRVLGYSVLENYLRDFENYYNSVVSDLKLMEQTDEYITYGEVATLVYNTMISNPMGYNPFGSAENKSFENDEMFMEKYMGISYIFGTVTNTGFVSLDADEVLNPGKIIINGSTELYKEKDNQYAEYIGRRVDCFYYNENSDKEGEIAFIGVSNKNIETVISADSEPEFNRENDSISYTENGKNKTKKLNDRFIVIKNNKVLESYSESDFEVSSGSIRIVETDNEDVLIISSYKDFFVSGIDEEEKKLYNGIKYIGDTVLDLDNDDMVCYIKTQQGEEIAVENIKQGNVLSICEGDTFTEIIVSQSDSITDTVTGISTDDGKTFLNLKNGSKLCVSAYYSNSTDVIIPKLKKEYYFYMNVFGQVAYISEESIDATVEMPYGYCWWIRKSEDEETLFVKILNQKDVWMNYEFASGFRFARKDGKEFSIKDNEKFLDFLNVDYGEESYRGIVRYTLDEEGKINYFELPITDTQSDKKGQLKYMGSVADKTWIIHGENLGPNLIVKNNVNTIIQKPQKQDESGNLIEREPEDYSMKSIPFVNWTKVTLDAYTINGDSPKADYIIRTTADAAVQLSVNSTNYAMALSDFYYTWDEYEGEVLLALDVINGIYEDENSRSVSVETFVFRDEAATMAKDSFKDFGSDKTYKLSRGDIFRYAKDSDGRITETMITWDESEPNKLSATFPNGNIAGSIGYYSASAGGFTNPVLIKDSGIQTNVAIDNVSNYRVTYGSVYKKYDGNVIRVTTQPIKGNSGYDESCSDKRFIDESVYIHNIDRIIAVNFNGGKVTAKAGSMSDIKSYEEYGTDCSRIVACYYLGVIRWAFIINGDSLK